MTPTFPRFEVSGHAGAVQRASVHFGTAAQIRAQRQVTLNRAYAAHPERFTR